MANQEEISRLNLINELKNRFNVHIKSKWKKSGPAQESRFLYRIVIFLFVCTILLAFSLHQNILLFCQIKPQCELIFTCEQLNISILACLPNTRILSLKISKYWMLNMQAHASTHTYLLLYGGLGFTQVKNTENLREIIQLFRFKMTFAFFLFQNHPT